MPAPELLRFYDHTGECAQCREQVNNAVKPRNAFASLMADFGGESRLGAEHPQYEQVESYITKHSEAKFSHGICPQCFDLHVKPELDRLEANRRGSDADPR